MLSFQGMQMRTDYMIEQMRRDAIDLTHGKWVAAVENYYRNGCDNGESVRYYKELVNLGVSSEVLMDEEFDIRELVLGV